MSKNSIIYEAVFEMLCRTRFVPAGHLGTREVGAPPGPNWNGDLQSIDVTPGNLSGHVQVTHQRSPSDRRVIAGRARTRDALTTSRGVRLKHHPPPTLDFRVERLERDIDVGGFAPLMTAVTTTKRLDFRTGGNDPRPRIRVASRAEHGENHRFFAPGSFRGFS